jgi:hypothetical protein
MNGALDGLVGNDAEEGDPMNMRADLMVGAGSFDCARRSRAERRLAQPLV